MQLRPRQVEFADKAVAALEKRGNTIGVAPTGFGKTVVISEITRRVLAGIQGRRPRALILQHRDELVAQNVRTFDDICAGAYSTSIIDGKFLDPHGDVIFGMVQSLARETKREHLPPVDLVVTDETHHSAAKTYLAIYDHMRALNPDCKLMGVTATANRADKKTLRGVYDNVCDIVTLTEVIRSGGLVPPIAKVIDLGVQDDLMRVRRTAADFDMREVEKIMNVRAHTDAIIQKWQQTAIDRQTVVFCSTVQHAKDVAEAFRGAGYSAACVEGKMSRAERARILEDFERREIQVITNVMVLTEGWDCQTVSCIMLLRPCSAHSTMIQMIGRGLRKVDPERFPGVLKSDCIVLDFGTSLLTHQTLDQDIELTEEERKRQKKCPKCASPVPAGAGQCPICGHTLPKPERGEGGGPPTAELKEFGMAEINILEASPFRWETFCGGMVHIATSFDTWAAVIQRASGDWEAYGSTPKTGAIRIERGGSMGTVFATADDFMRVHGKRSESGKKKSWLLQPPTEKQLQMLKTSSPEGLTRYRAACAITWKFNERAIKALASDAA